jgi:hypothetical protein
MAVIGVHSIMSGTATADFGGKKSAATATGVADAFSKLGSAIQAFQRNAVSYLNPDGIVSRQGLTIRRLETTVLPRPRHAVFQEVCWAHSGSGLKPDDYKAAAKTLNTSVAAIQAVAQTETMRASWDELGRPTILYERHYFSRGTKNQYDRSHPDISNKTSGGYGKFSAQYPKLKRAAVLDETEALKSASWGAFQIMGANHAAAGFATVDAFVDAMVEGEQRHLEAFVSFIAADSKKLKALQDLDWKTFARLYNGAGYATNQYDIKWVSPSLPRCWGGAA